MDQAETQADSTPRPSSSAPPATSRISGDEAERVLVEAARTAEANRRRAVAVKPPVRQEAAGLRVASEDEWAKVQERRRRFERRIVADECLRSAQVPPKFAGARLDDLDRLPASMQPKYAAVCTALRKLLTQPSLVALIGDVGRGKSHLMWALVNEFCLQGRSARAEMTISVISTIRKGYAPGSSRSVEQFIDRYARLGLLCLEEFQARLQTDDEQILLHRLIDRRLANQRPTLIVSNHLSREQFAADIDRRWASRMHEGGGVILCDWEDLRPTLGDNHVRQ